jgi:hypothetical protein
LASILPSEVQAWVTRLGVADLDRKALAPATIGIVHSLVSGVMKAAVGNVASSPTRARGLGCRRSSAGE